MKIKTLFLLFFCALSHEFAVGQSLSIYEQLEKASISDKVVQITLKDNSSVKGKIKTLDYNTVKITSDIGTFLIRLNKVKEVVILDPDNVTASWFKNPAQNKLFVTPSGRMMEAGSGYYQNTLIFLSTLSIGVTQYFTVSGSVSMIPSLGLQNQLYSVGAKLGSNINDHISISGTASYYSMGESETFGSLYTAGTYTKGRGDLTVGLGMGFSENGNSNPIMIFGGQLRVSEGFALISENFITTEKIDPGLTIGSLGVRFLGRKISADLGFFTVRGLDAFVPFASFTVKI